MKNIQKNAENYNPANGNIEPGFLHAEDVVGKLVACGFHVLPCGGKDGKRPIQKGWQVPTRRPSQPAVVVSILARAQSSTFGIRLDGLVVVDCDNRHSETIDWVKRHFPKTPFIVETPRGRHYYFRTNVTVRTSTVNNGHIRIDIKSGSSHQVLAPGSVRPDGGRYEWQSRAPGAKSDLPCLPDDFSLPDVKEPTKVRISKRIETLRRPRFHVGERNRLLSRKAISYAANSESLHELLGDLLKVRDIDVDEPESFPDDEVRKIADWAWEKRQQNRLYRGEKSTFEMERPAVGLLLGKHGLQGAMALSLYAVLKSAHGHKPGDVFAVAIDAMCREMLIPFSKTAGYRARAILVSEGLLVAVGEKQRGEPDQFRFGNALLL